MDRVLWQKLEEKESILFERFLAAAVSSDKAKSLIAQSVMQRFVVARKIIFNPNRVKELDASNGDSLVHLFSVVLHLERIPQLADSTRLDTSLMKRCKMDFLGKPPVAAFTIILKCLANLPETDQAHQFVLDICHCDTAGIPTTRICSSRRFSPLRKFGPTFPAKNRRPTARKS